MKVLVFQHTDGEHPAAFTVHAKAVGDAMTVICLHRGELIPALDDFDVLIVMGGPMDVWETDDHPWLIAERTAIAAWVGTGRPFLGICLGHQQLVTAMGGKCARLPVPQIGIGTVTQTNRADAIFDTLPQHFPTLQWNGVGATSLPQDAVVLAEGPACPIQAIRIGDCAWGVQFHPEIMPGLVASWLSDTGNWEGAIDWLGSEKAAKDFAQDSENHAEAAWTLSKALYDGLRASVRKKT